MPSLIRSARGRPYPRDRCPSSCQADWICTADMASYHQLPRPLSPVRYKELFNEELSKDAREQMAGLSLKEIQANLAFINYALEDSRSLSPCISGTRCRISRGRKDLLLILTRRIANRGLAIDGPLCQQFIDKMEKILEDTARKTTRVETGKPRPYQPSRN